MVNKCYLYASFVARNMAFHNNLEKTIKGLFPAACRGKMACISMCMDPGKTRPFADYVYTDNVVQADVDYEGSAPMLLAASGYAGLKAFYGVAGGYPVHGQSLATFRTYFPYLYKQPVVNQIIARMPHCTDIAETVPVDLGGQNLLIGQALTTLQQRGNFDVTNHIWDQIALFGESMSHGKGAAGRAIVLVYNEHHNKLTVALSTLVAGSGRSCGNVKRVCAAANLLTTPCVRGW
jgi:hypothetical protein